MNKVVHPESVDIQCDNYDESPLPDTFVDYETAPREYRLKTVQTILDVHTRISDLYSSPHDQIAQQLRLTIEAVKEHQESELVNSPEYGLLTRGVRCATGCCAGAQQIDVNAFHKHDSSLHEKRTRGAENLTVKAGWNHLALATATGTAAHPPEDWQHVLPHVLAEITTKTTPPRPAHHQNPHHQPRSACINLS